MAEIRSLAESHQFRDFIGRELGGAQILLRQVAPDIVENLSKGGSLGPELSIQRSLGRGELPGDAFHSRRVSRRRRDDLVDLPGHSRRCLHLAKDAIAGLLQDLRGKSMRHVRLRRKDRSGIGEFGHRLTKPNRAAQILPVKVDM